MVALRPRLYHGQSVRKGDRTFGLTPTMETIYG
jgi:hypothetical protein